MRDHQIIAITVNAPMGRLSEGTRFRRAMLSATTENAP